MYWYGACDCMVVFAYLPSTSKLVLIFMALPYFKNRGYDSSKFRELLL